MKDQKKWNRRELLRMSGGAAGAALLAGHAANPLSDQSAQEPRVAASAPSQQDAEMGAGAARFAYVGTYTRGAPGGWSEEAEKIHPVGISVFAVDPGLGDLSHVQTVPSDNPSFVALHPSGNYLYALNEIADYQGEEAGSVEAYAIDDETGELTLLNRQSTGTIPAHLSVDPTGSYLALATYVGGTYELFPIEEDGSLAPASDVAVQSGSGPHDRQQAPHCHAVVFDPGGNYLAGADLGTDTIKIFQIEEGQLVQVSEAMVAPGSGPRHVAFHPNGNYLYVISELAATITAFAYDAENGMVGEIIQTVGTVPQDFPEDKSTAEIMVHPSGQFLYGSNRKFEDHPLADAIVAYAIDPDTGKLKLVGFTTEGIHFPRSFNLDPTGTWLYALSQKGDTALQFFIEPTTGALNATGLVTEVMVPVSLVFKQ